MDNLLQETIEILNTNNLKLSDIDYISNYENGNYLEWSVEQFIKEANEINYDGGYGITKICTTLKIIGKDWWLERNEYDGAEWWEFKKFPNKPNLKGTGNISFWDI